MTKEKKKNTNYVTKAAKFLQHLMAKEGGKNDKISHNSNAELIKISVKFVKIKPEVK